MSELPEEEPTESTAAPAADNPLQRISVPLTLRLDVALELYRLLGRLRGYLSYQGTVYTVLGQKLAEICRGQGLDVDVDTHPTRLDAVLPELIMLDGGFHDTMIFDPDACRWVKRDDRPDLSDDDG